MDLLNKLPWDLRVVILTQFLPFFKLRNGQLMQQLAVENRVILQLLLAIAGVHSSVFVFDTTVYVSLNLPETTRKRVLLKNVTATGYQVNTFILITDNNEASPTIKDYQTGICC